MVVVVLGVVFVVFVTMEQCGREQQEVPDSPACCLLKPPPTFGRVLLSALR